MNAKTKILRNISLLTVGRVTSDILAFIFYATLARVFGESEMGNYAFAYALAYLLGFSVELGIRPLLTREVAKDEKKAPKYLANLVILQIILAIVVFILLRSVSIAMGYDDYLQALLMMAFLANTYKSIGITFVACLEASDSMGKAALVDIIERFVILITGFSLVLAGLDLLAVMIATVLGEIAYMGLAIYWVRKKFGRLPFDMDRTLVIRTVVASLPFLGASALNVLYSRVDVMMIHEFVGKAETGAYAIAYRFVESSLMVAMMAGLAIYPSLSRSFNEASTKPNYLFVAALKWLAMLGAVGSVLLVVAGDKVLVVVFGDTYAYSGELIRYMSVLFFIGCIKVPYWRLQFAMHREKIQLLFQAISIVINISLNIIFIPKYGGLGAVWASIISELILLMLFHWDYVKRYKITHIKGGASLVLAASVAMFAGLGIRDILSWPVVVIVVLALFCVSVLLLGLVSREEKTRIAVIFQGIIRRS